MKFYLFNSFKISYFENFCSFSISSSLLYYLAISLVSSSFSEMFQEEEIHNHLIHPGHSLTIGNPQNFYFLKEFRIIATENKEV